MTDLDALDLAASMERAGLAPGLIRRELRARGAPESTVDTLAPSWSPCGVHEHDRDPGDRCPVCTRARDAIEVTEISQAGRTALDRWAGRVHRAGGVPRRRGPEKAGSIPGARSLPAVLA